MSTKIFPTGRVSEYHLHDAYVTSSRRPCHVIRIGEVADYFLVVKNKEIFISNLILSRKHDKDDAIRGFTSLVLEQNVEIFTDKDALMKVAGATFLPFSDVVGPRHYCPFTS